jgi:heptosyltransferase-1
MSERLNILVIRLSAMGDVIHALPAVASLKASFPQSRVSWIIKPVWAPLIENNPSVDEIIPFERTARGVAAVLRRLRATRFDLVIDYQGLLQTGILAGVARAKQVIGLHRSQAREPLASLFYSQRVRTVAKHRVDQCIELASAAGAATLVHEFPLPEGRAEGTLPEGRFVLACPLAGWGSKQWPLDYYTEVARELPVPLVVNGPPSSAAQLAQVRGAILHQSGLPGLIHATRRAQAVIGVDSGPLHLAAALGKPGVAIFGPTDPASHGPYGGTVRVLRIPAAETTYKRSPAEAASMRAIEPRAVIEALEAALVHVP